MKTIVVLSGKGGVGKSSITASLATMLAQQKKIICVDCDVDASNLHLLFDTTMVYTEKRISTNEVAVINDTLCAHCGLCEKTCYFDAIDKDQKVIAHNCEGCGACVIACPHKAITLQAVDNATLSTKKTTYGFYIVSAQLDPGATGSGKVVAEVKKEAEKYGHLCDYALIDAAAGIGCPVIASVTGSDYGVVVIEPTPASLADAKRAVDILSHFSIPYSIIINKSDLNSSMIDKINDFASKADVHVIGSIRYDKAFSKAITKMMPITEYDNSYKEIFSMIAKNLLKELEDEFDEE